MELNAFLEEIMQNTGIALSAREGEIYEITVKDGKTFFPFRYGTKQYIGELDGATKTEENYAYLLSSVIEAKGTEERTLDKDEYLKNILLGDYNSDLIQKYMIKYGVPDTPCYVLAIRTDKRLEEMMAQLVQCMTNSSDTVLAMSPDSCAVVKFVDGMDDYQSSYDFATFLEQSLYEELGVHTVFGIGSTVGSLYDSGKSYRQAAATIRMNALFGSKGKVYTYKEFVLIKMLEELPRQRLEEYMGELLDEDAREILEDEDMIDTAEEFLQNSLNVSETSRNLYMHRNTLMYRLDKIERFTGLNIRKFSDAVSFRILTTLYKLINK